MRAGDLTPGWYHAHGSHVPNCQIHDVEHKRYEVFIDYTYEGVRKRRVYAKNVQWNVTREQIEIAEDPDWLALLQQQEENA